MTSNSLVRRRVPFIPTIVWSLVIATLSLPSTARAAPGTADPIDAICKAQDAPADSSKKRFSLPQLLKKARTLAAEIGDAERRAAQWDRWRAKWAWTPKLQIRGLFAPSPSVKCENADCTRTSNPNLTGIDLDGVFGRISADLAMPLYTFGKISAAKRAAEAGVMAASERARQRTGEVALKVVRAYWGLKMAREILYTVCDGRKHVLKERARIEKALAAQDADDDDDDDDDEAAPAPPATPPSKASPRKAKAKAGKTSKTPKTPTKAPPAKDEGDDNTVTVMDMARIKVYQTLVDARLLEAMKLERFTHQALALLVGVDAAHFDVDTAVLKLVDGKLLPVASYAALARRHRPEVRLLEAAVRARKAALSLEKSSFLPNLVLVASGVAAGAHGVDDPHNAFYNDPFNVVGVGFGLALSWDLDVIQRYGTYRKARALAESMALQKKLALTAIDIDIRQAYENLREARLRRRVLERAQRAVKSWLTAIVQNLAAGLGQPKELTDVLPKYFEVKLKYIQAINDINFGWAKLARAIGVAAQRDASSQPSPVSK